jgi:predicted nucleic acid-binding protein
VAVSGWVLDKSAASREDDPIIRAHLAELVRLLYVCPVGELEQLYSARLARAYDLRRELLHGSFQPIAAPIDNFDRALRLQRDLAHHHGLWHRIPMPDLLIAETALHHDLGGVHVDGDFARIAEVRPLVVRRLG